MKQREKKDKIFQERMAKKTDELRWLYMELYGNDSMFSSYATSCTASMKNEPSH